VKVQSASADAFTEFVGRSSMRLIEKPQTERDEKGWTESQQYSTMAGKVPVASVGGDDIVHSRSFLISRYPACKTRGNI